MNRQEAIQQFAHPMNDESTFAPEQLRVFIAKDIMAAIVLDKLDILLGQNPIAKAISGYFSPDQIALIESKVVDYKDSLLAVMQNIVDHNGTFVPTQEN